MKKTHIILLSIALIITTFYSCNKPTPLSEIQKNVKELSDKDPKKRAKAAYNLGEIGDCSVLPRLLPALNDPDQEVRRTVISTLFEIRAVSTIPELMLLANNKDEAEIIRCDAIKVSLYLWLRNKTDYDLFPDIIELYKDAGEQLRASVIESLIDSRDQRAVNLINNAVKDNSPEVRITALNSLLSIGDVSGLPTVISCLGDVDPKVRKAAINALAIGGESSIPYLKKMLNDEEYFVVINAAVILNKFGNTAGIQPLKKMLDDKPKISVAAAMVLYNEMGDKSGIPVLIDLLNHENDEVKMTAAGLLSMGDTEAVNALMPLLKDKNPEIRTQAAVTLGKIGNVLCVPALLTALKNDTVPAFRRVIVQALGQLPCNPSVESLKGTLYDKDLSVRIFSVNSLSRVGNSKIIPLLNSILLKEDEHVEVKMAIIIMYRTLGFRQTSDIISKLLKNTDSQLRAMSGSLLSEWGEKEYIDDIIELLSDKEIKVKAATIVSLQKMGNPSAAVPVVGFLKNKQEDEQIRILSAITVGKLGDKDVIPALTEIVRDKKDIISVRNTAIHALGELRDKKAIPVLIKILKNEKGIILVSSATQALGFIKDKSASPYIVPLLNSEIKDIRLMALGTLLELKDSTTVPALMKLLLKKITVDKEIDYEAEQICELLGNIKDKRAKPLLKELWKHGSGTLRPSVAKALYQLGETYTIQYIKDLAIEKENIGLQVRAIRSLGELGDKSTLEVVIEGLNSSESSVRKESVIALGSLGNESSIALLEKMLNKEDVSMDVTINEAMARLGNKPGFERLISMLSEGDKHVRAEVMDALVRLQNKSALPFLNKIKENDISWELRKKAHETIGQISAVES